MYEASLNIYDLVSVLFVSSFLDTRRSVLKKSLNLHITAGEYPVWDFGWE